MMGLTMKKEIIYPRLRMGLQTGLLGLVLSVAPLSHAQESPLPDPSELYTDILIDTHEER